MSNGHKPEMLANAIVFAYRVAVHSGDTIELEYDRRVARIVNSAGKVRETVPVRLESWDENYNPA